MDALPRTLYEVLDFTCTGEHLQKFLQGFKNRGFDDLRTTGSKENQIAQIKLAVTNHIIRESDVVDLIRDYEESGKQHIFFYKPKNAAAKATIANGEQIGEKLLGNRLSDGSLPNYSLRKKEYVWADFRHSGTNGPWTAKIYGHQERVKFQKQDEKEGFIVRYYDKTEKRIVCLAHWNGTELEIRIGIVGAGGTVDRYKKSSRIEVEQKNDSLKETREIDIRLGIMSNFVSGAGLMDGLVPWDLTRTCRKMIAAVMDEREKGIAPKDSELPFVTPRVRFRDSGYGSAEFNSQLEEEAVTTTDVRAEAIRAYLSAKSASCRRLIVVWDADSGGGMWGERPLRTIVGASKENELVIAAGVNPQTVQYVTNQLRRFGI